MSARLIGVLLGILPLLLAGPVPVFASDPSPVATIVETITSTPTPTPSPTATPTPTPTAPTPSPTAEPRHTNPLVDPLLQLFTSVAHPEPTKAPAAPQPSPTIVAPTPTLQPVTQLPDTAFDLNSLPFTQGLAEAAKEVYAPQHLSETQTQGLLRLALALCLLGSTLLAWVPLRRLGQRLTQLLPDGRSIVRHSLRRAN